MINNTDVLKQPLIDYAAVTDPTDLSILYAVYMANRALMAMPSMAILGPKEIDPAPDVADENEIKEALKRYLQPSNAHQCCTASMMPREEGGVVDSMNRVYGTKGLSVVDASTWIVNVGNAPMPSIYAGAEKVCLPRCWW